MDVSKGISKGSLPSRHSRDGCQTEIDQNCGKMLTPFCGQAGKVWIELYEPFVIGRGGCGALNLLFPVGGAANGIFW